MTDQGKANYEGFHAAIPGSSPVPFEEVPHAERLRWDCGATSVELWLSQAPVDEDMPGGEPDDAARDALAAIARAAQGHADSTGTVDLGWLLETALRGLGWAAEPDYRALLDLATRALAATSPEDAGTAAVIRRDAGLAEL